MLLRLLTPLLIGLLLITVAYATYFWISRKLEHARKLREKEIQPEGHSTPSINSKEHQVPIISDQNKEATRAKRHSLTKVLFFISATVLIVSGILATQYHNIVWIYQVYSASVFTTACLGLNLLPDLPKKANDIND